MMSFPMVIGALCWFNVVCLVVVLVANANPEFDNHRFTFTVLLAGAFAMGIAFVLSVFWMLKS